MILEADANPDIDMQEAVGSRQKLEAQRQENLGVQKVRPNLHLIEDPVANYRYRSLRS